MSEIAQRQFLGIAELANRWGVSAFTVRRAINRGDLQSVHIGARILVNLTEIQRAEKHGVGRARKAGAAKSPTHRQTIQSRKPVEVSAR